MAGSVSSGVAQTREARAGRGSRRPTLDDFERLAWPAFGAAASVAALIILWLGSGVGYSLDEIDTLIRTPGLDFDGTLEPHNGHFIFTTRVAYWAILELFGTDYLAFRLLTLATVVLTAALFLAYAGRRIGKLPALALALLLLFFGSHPSHVMNGNGFTVLFAIACGLAALLLLERNDRGGDIGACALLCLGVATYTTGLPFVAGAAVAILLRDERWRRIWIVAVPVAIYFAWWLSGGGPDRRPHRPGDGLQHPAAARMGLSDPQRGPRLGHRLRLLRRPGLGGAGAGGARPWARSPGGSPAVACLIRSGSRSRSCSRSGPWGRSPPASSGSPTTPAISSRP